MHDIYNIIIDSWKFVLVMLGAVIFFGTVYSFTQEILFSRKLAWLHIGLTSIALLILAASPLMKAIREIKAERGAYYEAVQTSLKSLTETTLLILVVTQFLFLINLLAGIVQKMSSTRNPRMPHY